MAQVDSALLQYLPSTSCYVQFIEFIFNSLIFIYLHSHRLRKICWIALKLNLFKIHFQQEIILIKSYYTK